MKGKIRHQKSKMVLKKGQVLGSFEIGVLVALELNLKPKFLKIPIIVDI